MSYYLCIQSTYETLEASLMNDTQCIARGLEDKKASSKSFVALFCALLNQAGISLNDLSFIVVNQGPAPFTSLRVVLAAAQGIHAATGIPLIGVDGLITFFKKENIYPVTVALLNAYNKEVYYAFNHQETLHAGYQNITLLINELQTLFAQQLIHFTGGGALLYQDLLNTAFPKNIVLKDAEYTSLDALAQAGYQEWLTKKSGSSQLLPLYLKQTL